MTQVSSKTIWIKPLGRKWRRVTFFDKKFGGFVIPMPKPFIDMFPKLVPLRAKTVDELESLFNKVILQWEEAATTTRRVILYRFAINLMSEPNEENWRKCLRQDFKSSFENFPDNALGFEWENCTERTIDGEARYFRFNGDDDEFNNKFSPSLDPPDPDDEDNTTRAIDWTAERESFFKAMESSIRQLILRAQDFENKIKDPKILDRLASSQSETLLLAPAKERT